VIRKTSCLLFGLLIACAAFAREEYTRTFDKTLTLQRGQHLFIEHKFGDVVIRTHPQPEIVLHALIHVSAGSLNEAKSYADRIEILVEPSSSELSIRTRYPESRTGVLNFRNVSYSVRYEITMPETAPLEIRNGFGAVSVAGLKANSQITNSHCDIELRDCRGVQHLEDSFGSVRVLNNTGDVFVENTNGPVDASDISGALSIRDRFASINAARIAHGVTIVNNNGSVQVNESGGAGTIRNSFGSVTVSNFHGDLTVNNANGAVEAGHVDGAAELNTTFGQVMFSYITRQLSIRANNSKIEGGHVGGPLNIVNSFGSVTVNDVQASHIQSGNGGITISKAGGAANVKTSFAPVEATDVSGLVSVQNQNGGVKVSRARGVQIVTSFSPVHVEAIDGPVQIENRNGNVDAWTTARGACQPVIIHTSFSPIRVRLPTDASYRVYAKTSFAKIHTDFPLVVSGGLSTDDLNGAIGSGACEMRLTDNNGAIEILKSGS